MDEWGIIPLLLCGCFIMLIAYWILKTVFAAIWQVFSNLSGK
jgi:hypothetical protein